MVDAPTVEIDTLRFEIKINCLRSFGIKIDPYSDTGKEFDRDINEALRNVLIKYGWEDEHQAPPETI